MSKREYTHVRVLLPEIRAMVESGKTQREIAEHFGLRSRFSGPRGELSAANSHHKNSIVSAYLGTP